MRGLCLLGGGLARSRAGWHGGIRAEREEGKKGRLRMSGKKRTEKERADDPAKAGQTQGGTAELMLAGGWPGPVGEAEPETQAPNAAEEIPQDGGVTGTAEREEWRRVVALTGAEALGGASALEMVEKWVTDMLPPTDTRRVLLSYVRQRRAYERNMGDAAVCMTAMLLDGREVEAEVAATLRKTTLTARGRYGELMGSSKVRECVS